MARSTFYGYVSAGKITVSPVDSHGGKKKFVAVSELREVFGKLFESNTIEHFSEHNRTLPPDDSELARLRQENAVLSARLEEAREAKAIAERDKENLMRLLSGSMDTVKFLEARSVETVQLLELRKDGKKPGWLSRFFGGKPKP